MVDVSRRAMRRPGDHHGPPQGGEHPEHPLLRAKFPSACLSISAGALATLEAFFRAMTSDGRPAPVLIQQFDPTRRARASPPTCWLSTRACPSSTSSAIRPSRRITPILCRRTRHADGGDALLPWSSIRLAGSRRRADRGAGAGIVGRPLRVCIRGCATGEEAYSMRLRAEAGAGCAADSQSEA